VRVTVVKPSELGPGEAELWASFQRVSPETVNPFFSMTFVQAVGRARPSARVAVVEDNSKIEAFLPFELTPKNIAIAIGWPMNDLHGFVSSGATIDARSVVRMTGLRGWVFDHAPASQELLVRYHYRGTTVQCPVIDLTVGYDTYFRDRSRSLRRKMAQSRHGLERDAGPLSLEWNSPNPQHLRQLIEWKSRKYDFTGLLFSDPTALQIVEELAMTDNADCGGVLSVLLAGEKPIAFFLNLRSPRGLSGWFAAYDDGLARFSPGTTLLLAVAQEAARRDITRLDLGYGQHRYKFRLANDFYPVVKGAVWASPIEQLGRAISRRFRHVARYCVQAVKRG
jgi:CelD/BcsL family acetyltransferase involved in cellulose biosynthesis